MGNLRAEDVLNIINGVIGIFDDIMEQGSADGGGTQSNFVADNLGHGNRVHDVGLARAAFDAAMGLVGKVERLGYNFHPLAVLGGKII